MMRSIERTTKFKRDYKREKKTDPSLDEAFLAVIVLLADDDELPERLRDHSLGGEWKGYRDCHIRPDLVLIYSKEEGKLTLARLGSHSELFG
ncbi:MAG: mRNA interferase YafQ [Sphingomonadales bacterium]|jgi:mRNA interferase YafQ|nr:mRNA interferase YafQ [Sphingomonadales bacterium]